MNLNNLKVCALAGFLGLTTFAFGDVLVDRSPNTVPGAVNVGDWANMATHQNFLDDVSFDSQATITGFGIYSGSLWGYIGMSVTVQIFSDIDGAPGVLMYKFAETITEINTDGSAGLIDINDYKVTQKIATFDKPLVLASGTYWVGMSGTEQELALVTYNSLQDGSVYRLNKSDIQLKLPSLGDAAFRLYTDNGGSDKVPDSSATLVLCSLSCLGLALLRRRA